MAENGCGITALAIILSGYDQNILLKILGKKYYPVLDYDTLSKELSNTFNIKNTDFIMIMFIYLKKSYKSI